MAIVRVQSAFNSGSSSNPSVTLGSASTTGNCIIFVYCWAGTLAIADDPTYNAASGGAGPGIVYTAAGPGLSTYTYYFINITGTATPIVSHPGVVPSAWCAAAVEYSGIRTTMTAYDVGSADEFTAEHPPQSSGTTASTAQAKEVALGIAAVVSNTLAITDDATYTSIGNVAHGSAALKLQLADKLLNTITTENFDIEYEDSNHSGSVLVGTWKDQDATGGLIHLPLGMCG